MTNMLKQMLLVAGGIAASAATAQTAAPPGGLNVNVQNTPSVTVVNPPSMPVPVEVTKGPVATEPGHQRISIVGFVSLDNGELTAPETASQFDVPAGKVLVIENVQYDTNAACFFRYIPTVRVDRPVSNGTRFDRYSLDVVSPTPFTSGGGAFMSAATRSVSINVPAFGSVKFGFSRNASDCFGQIRYRVDGRLEPAR